MKRVTRLAMLVLWPAFLMAGVLEMLVFSLVDPGSLRWFGGAPVEMSATAVYSLAFFAFASVNDMATLAQRPALTAEAFRTAFVGANPRYPRESIGLMLGEGGTLQEVHLCHDRTFHPAPCPMRSVPDTAPMRITER